ncbi:MAG TPA: UDP-N-acetylmuramoyl-tripeptide--D-alanyl-D-alanine ligase [Desulfomonilia bacterium]
MRGRLIDAASITGGTLLEGNPETPFAGISTDSRLVTKGELFIALKGDNFNGHDFVRQAFERGAAAAVVELTPDAKGLNIIQVEDTLAALGALAAYNRRLYDAKITGITGSAGKTTVKEMIASILALAGNVLKTQKNYNNLIGVPMRLLDLRDEHDFAVIEMGTNSPGEIRRLAGMTMPDVSVLTGIVPAHLKGLGSMEGIISEKQSIFEYTTGTAVYDPNGEYTKNVVVPESLRKITFSLKYPADVFPCEVHRQDLTGTIFTAALRDVKIKIKTSLPGMHNVQNALAACACALAFDIEPGMIQEGIEKAVFPGMRSEIVVSDGLTIIDDSYNANPGSMKAALDILSTASHSVKIAVLGDMLELGEDALFWHKELGRWAASSNISQLIITGEMALTVKEAAYNAGLDIRRITIAENVEDIKNTLARRSLKDAIILVKASRSLKLDRVVAYLKEAA